MDETDSEKDICVKYVDAEEALYLVAIKDEDPLSKLDPAFKAYGESGDEKKDEKKEEKKEGEAAKPAEPAKEGEEKEKPKDEGPNRHDKRQQIRLLCALGHVAQKSEEYDTAIGHLSDPILKIEELTDKDGEPIPDPYSLNKATASFELALCYYQKEEAAKAAPPKTAEEPAEGEAAGEKKPEEKKDEKKEENKDEAKADEKTPLET